MPKASEHVEMLSKMAAREGYLSGMSAALNISLIRGTFTSIGALDEHTAKSLRGHFLVSLVTNIEVFFRGAVATLIDHGSPYIERADPLIRDLKFDVHSIQALQGRKITLGEVISLVPSYQGLDRICSTMTTLIGTSFLRVLALQYDRWEVEVNHQPKKPIIDNIDDLARTLSRLFELRHIVVHELPKELPVSSGEIQDFIECTEKFLEAARWYITELLDPGAPLQQQPMNARAAQKAHDVNGEMETLYATLRALVREDRQIDLDISQAAWRSFRRAMAEFEGNEYRGGSLMPLIAATAHKKLTTERIAFLRQEIKIREHDPQHA
jgi:uncharacterized protein YecT (DUF1311 family)